MSYPAPSPAEIHPASSRIDLDSGSQRPNRLRKARHLARIWNRVWLQALAALGAAAIGSAFGYLVARNDHVMEFFFTGAVGIGLFFVFSAFASKLHRSRRRRPY